LALGKSTWQSSTHRLGESSKAVDGIANPNWFTGLSCSHTNYGDLHPWWAVDLGGLYDVSLIEMVNRGDCCGKNIEQVLVKSIEAVI